MPACRQAGLMFVQLAALCKQSGLFKTTLNVKRLTLKLLDNHTGVVSAKTKCVA